MKFKRILSAILLFAFLCGQSSVPSLALLPETSSVAHAEDKKTVTVPTEKEVYGKKLETILSFSTRYNEDPALILTDSKEKIGNFHDAIVDVRTNAEKTKTYYPALEQSFFDLASQHEDQLTNLIRQIHEFREDEKNEVAKERALKNSDFLKKNYYPTLISTLQKAGIKPGEETTAATVCALPRWNEITKKMKELAYPKNNLVDEILIANLCAKPNEVVIKTEASYNSYWSQLEAEQEKIRQAYSDTVYGFSLLTSPAKDKGNEYWEKDSSGKYQLSHWKPSNYATFTDKIFKGAGLNPLFSSASRGTYIVGQSIGIYEGKEGIQVGGEYLGSDGSLVQLKQAISNANALSLILFSEAAKQFSKPEYTAGLYDDLIVENRTNFEDGAWFGNKENPTLFNKDAKPVKTVREAMAMVTFYDPVDPNSDPRAKEIYDSQKEIGDKVANGYQSTTPEPCGSSGIGLVKGLSQGVCALVVFSHRFITSILWSSTYLLSTQANFFKRCEDGSVSCGSDINYASKDESSGAAADLLGQFEGTEFTDPIQNIVVDTTNTNIGTVVQLAYGTSLKFLNFLLILIFLAIAIANILQIQINNYSVKKVLPGLLIGFMVAQFSLFLIRGSLELADQVGKGVLSQATNSNMSFRGFITAFSSFPFTVEEIAKTSSPNCKPERDVAWLTIGCGTTNGSSDVDFNKVFKLALVDIFTLIASVFLLVLGFQFILRRIVFFFLIPLAPLAFAVSTFDPAKKLWSTWQKNFWNWLIMPLVASFWLWLALLWLSNGTIGNGGPLAAIMSYLFAFFALFQAVKSPSQYAGDAKAALGSWNKFGKSVFGDRAKYAIARYTPAGALTRGYLKNQALWKEKQKEQLEGDVFKSKTARALGGDAINRRIEGSWKEQDRKKKDQESYSERIKQRAEEDVFNRDLRRERGIAARNAQSEQIKERLHDERDKLTTDYKRNNESYKELQAAIELETEANTNFKNGLKKEITARTKEIKKGHAFHEWQKSKAFEMDATNRDLNAETERGSGDDFAKAFERNVVVKELKAKIESNWESERKAAAYTQMAADVGGAFSKVDREEIENKNAEAKAKNERDKITYQLLLDNQKLKELRNETEHASAAGKKNIDKALNEESVNTVAAIEAAAHLKTLLSKKTEEMTEREIEEAKRSVRLLAESGGKEFGRYEDFVGKFDNKKLRNTILERYGKRFNIETKMGKDGVIDFAPNGARMEKLYRGQAAAFLTGESDDAAKRGETTSFLTDPNNKTKNLQNLSHIMNQDLDKIENSGVRIKAATHLGSIVRQLSKGELPIEEGNAVYEMLSQPENRELVSKMSHDGDADKFLSHFKQTVNETSRNQAELWRAMQEHHFVEHGNMSSVVKDNPAAALIPKHVPEELNPALKNRNAWTKARNAVNKRQAGFEGDPDPDTTDTTGDAS